jgi:hypothetical protein
MNVYHYALNDPIGDFDPLGLNNFGGPFSQSSDPNAPFYKPGGSASDECFSKCIGTALANLANPIPVDIPFEGLSGGNEGGVGGAEAAEGAAQAGDRLTRLSKNDQRDLDRAIDLLSRRSASSRSPDTNRKIAKKAAKLEGAKKLAKKLGTVGDIIGLLDFGSEVAKCREQCKDPNCPTAP